ncbi:MAG: hypothetical protein ABIK86_06230 [candidate division WOR-3 bacterium]
MRQVLEWGGHEVEMEIAFSPRFLMFATDTSLWVDRKLVARKGGLGVCETAVGYFEHGGRKVRAELKVCGGLSVFTQIPYVLRFDEQVVKQGKLKLGRLGAAVWVWVLVLAFLCVLVLTLLPA